MIFRHLSPLALCLQFLFPVAAHAEGKSIIILDASGSMWGQIDGRPKLEIARETLGSVLSGLPAQTELGLMAYGHREKGSCTDIEMVVAPAAGTAPAIINAANAMRFLGKTPLSEAVRQAAAQLRSTEEKATVILITDGIETCNADPCALGAELEASGVDFTAHVVGFGLTADEGRQVACLAENTGGKYIEAKDASTLVEALQSTVAVVQAEPEPSPAPEPPPPAKLERNLAPRVYLAAGGPAEGDDFTGSVEIYQIGANGARGDLVRQQYGLAPMFIDPGTYLLVVDRDEAVVEVEVTLTDDQLATPDIVLNAGYLHIRPLLEEGGEVIDNSGVTLEGAGRSIFHYGNQTRLVPAGDYTATVGIGRGTASASVTVGAGETVTKDVIVSVGVAVVDTYYTADIIVDNIGQAVDIFEAKVGLDGNRRQVEGGYGAAQEFTLPPGDYVALATKDVAKAEATFTVKPNERVAVNVVLNAGVLAVSAPGAGSIEVFSAKKSLDGSRKSMRFDYGDQMNLTFPPGDYIVVVNRDGAATESPITVVAGERAEITVAAP
jgi:Ca-activated chloride channel homolog